MPKVVTPLNLDFDEKEEFIRLFGKDKLSEFCRRAIHEALEEKNREASLSIDLSAIKPIKTITVPKHEVINNTLDSWINQGFDLETVLKVEPKVMHLAGVIQSEKKRNHIIRWKKY